MILLDTNIFIYLAQGSLNIDTIKNKDIAYSSITKIEALGYTQITAAEQNFLLEIFNECEQLNLDEQVINEAIKVRQHAKISLGDAIVAATSKTYDYELLTANVEDFKHVDSLKLFNPLK